MPDLQFGCLQGSCEKVEASKTILVVGGGPTGGLHMLYTPQQASSCPLPVCLGAVVASETSS